MSFSVSTIKSTLAEVEADILDQLAKVVELQPVHAVDMGNIKAAFIGHLRMLGEDLARDVTASVSGSVWQKEDGVEQASVSINVSKLDRKKE